MNPIVLFLISFPINSFALFVSFYPSFIRFRHWDISANERFEILREYTNHGLEHWGSDTKVWPVDSWLFFTVVYGFLKLNQSLVLSTQSFR